MTRNKIIRDPNYDPLLAETPRKKGEFYGPPSQKGKKHRPNITKQQRLAFHKHMVEKKPLKVALIEGGYAESTATRNVDHIVTSKAWLALMDQFIPESVVAEAHEKLFGATVETSRHVPIGTDEEGKTKYDVIYSEKQDVGAVTKAVDMAYKLRGAYKEKEATAQGANVYNLFYKPEVRESVRNFEDALKLQIINDSGEQSTNDVSASDSPIGNLSRGGTLYDVGQPPQPTGTDEPTAG